MPIAPLVLVTSTSEVIDGRTRVGVSEAFCDALVATGVIPLILPPVSPDVATAALGAVAGLLLSGGGSEDIDPSYYHEAPHPATAAPHPRRDACEIALARAAARRRVPTLAICRGAQVVNVALGGSLIQDVPSDHPRGRDRVHAVEIARDSRLASILGETRIRVPSLHHQAIGAAGSGVRVVGSSPDGIVEGIEAADPAWWMVGVQWRSEELFGSDEEWDRHLFRAFARAVRDGRSWQATSASVAVSA
jgi:putative glutamine amidotransferase